MPKQIFSIWDLGPDGVGEVLERAACLRRERRTPSVAGCAGLVFFEASLRTRVGFSVAASRVGLRIVEVYEPRAGPTSIPESVEDTLRVVSGYTDLLVVRGLTGGRSSLEAEAAAAYLNAGDRSSEAEHPSQALVDLFAIDVMLDGAAPEHVVVWGDPSMRAARSFVTAVAMTCPSTQVSVVSHESYLQRFTPPPELAMNVLTPAESLPDDVDVLYVTGMAHASLPLPLRDQLIVTPEVLARCPRSAVVLSPMPVIDEISYTARRDERVRFFEQSDLAIWARMALLEWLLEP